MLQVRRDTMNAETRRIGIAGPSPCAHLTYKSYTNAKVPDARRPQRDNGDSPDGYHTA